MSRWSGGDDASAAFELPAAQAPPQVGPGGVAVRGDDGADGGSAGRLQSGSGVQDVKGAGAVEGVDGEESRPRRVESVEQERPRPRAAAVPLLPGSPIGEDDGTGRGFG